MATAPSIVREPALRRTERGVRFAVHAVEPARERLPEVRPHQALAALLGGPVESCFDFHTPLLAGIEGQPLILSALWAYAEHRPLVIAPDAVWLTILQGLAHHVAIDPEKHREQLVEHRGRRTCSVSVRGFFAGSPENDWPRVFDALCEELSSHGQGDFARWATTGFSTSGPVERAAFQVALLDIMQPFHDYEVNFICGIPTVELTGTAADWKAIAARIERLDDFGMQWWTRALRPLCRQLVEAAEGRVDLEHWSQIIKRDASYGGPVIDGWLPELVPYLCVPGSGLPQLPNPMPYIPRDPRTFWEEPPRVGRSRGFAPRLLPTGLSRVPFRLEADGEVRSMECVAGLVGIAQHPGSGALEARVGWTVRRRGALAAVLDELERRGAFENPPAEPTPHLVGLPRELLEIQSRGDGAALATSSGRPLGRLLPLAEQTMTCYADGVFKTERITKQTSLSIEKHPALGCVHWRGVVQLGSEVIAIGSFGKDRATEYWRFDPEQLAETGAYQPLGQSLTEFLRELIER